MSSSPLDPRLAIHGGTPVRTAPMPVRVAFGDDEVAKLNEAVEYYRSRQQDPPYQGVFEEEFCRRFVDFMGGGHADAVATGTAACYVGLAALDLPKGSEVLLSPVTDSGPLNCIIAQGLVPVVVDSKPDSYNAGLEQILARVTPRTSAIFAVHCAGEPMEIDAVVDAAHARGIRVLEDCSQAPGAVWRGRRVGSFGDVAAFSTMYRKTLHSGGSGGVVYSRDLDVHRRALAHADRGKPVWRTDINLRDPSHAAFPALNFNTDELSCAIATASLARLQDAVDARMAFLRRLVALLRERSSVCRPYALHDGFSPFFFPILVDVERISCGKEEFARAVAAEGIDLAPHYGCVVSTWTYAKPYLADDFVAANAVSTSNRSFNLFLNERYGEQEAQDVAAAIHKVERHFARPAGA